MAKRSVKSRGKAASKPTSKAAPKKAKPATRPKAAAKRVKAKAAGTKAKVVKAKPRAKGKATVVKAKAASTNAKVAKAKPRAKGKATVVKAKPPRIGSTAEREIAALAVAGETAANENAPTPQPSLSTAPLATIAPRGVFLPDRVVVDIEGDTFPSTKLDEHGRDEAILPGATLEQVKLQAAEGQRLVDDDPRGAFQVFRTALEQLPQPYQNWNAAGWLLVAMGECAVRAGDWLSAILPLKDAMHCPGTIGNPWVHLRLGQVRLELADERAADELARAYMGGGRSLFEGLDPKYFALVEQVLQPPPGHDRLP